MTSSSELTSTGLPLRCLLTGRENWTPPAVTLVKRKVLLVRIAFSQRYKCVCSISRVIFRGSIKIIRFMQKSKQDLVLSNFVKLNKSNLV